MSSSRSQPVSEGCRLNRQGKGEQLAILLSSGLLKQAVVTLTN